VQVKFGSPWYIGIMPDRDTHLHRMIQALPSWVLAFGNMFKDKKIDLQRCRSID